MAAAETDENPYFFLALWSRQYNPQRPGHTALEGHFINYYDRSGSRAAATSKVDVAAVLVSPL